MDPKRRTLLKVVVPKPAKPTDKLVESLMGRKPELRLKFIQENADFVRDLDV
jgi:topoisomerase-4 subunit B